MVSLRHSPWSLMACAVSTALLVAFPPAGHVLCAQESPFVPAGFGSPAPAAPTASALDRFEFCGVMTIGSDTFVTFVDTTTSRAFSLTVGDTVEGVRATNFRADDSSVQIESGGQAKRLKLKEAKIVAMAAPPPPPASQPGVPPIPGQQPGGGAAVAGAPISDEEARVRMQRVAEEIRRRREMRRQMLENQQQGRPANQ